MGRQICAGGSASGASKPASTTAAFRSRQGQKRNPPLQPGGLETFIGGLSVELKPDSFLSRGAFLPSRRHRAGRVADDHGAVNYYRIAETAIALSCRLTFALVGWWEIADGISRAR